MSRSATFDGRPPGSIPATRPATGNTGTPSGTDRAARFESERRSGCGRAWTSPRWRKPRRPSRVATTSAPSAGPIRSRSGPSIGSGSGEQGSTVTIDVRADAFLRGMVRRIVAALLAVGKGQLEASAVPGLLAARDRPFDGAAAPAQGLCLRRVVLGRRRETAERTERTQDTRNDERQDVHRASKARSSDSGSSSMRRTRRSVVSPRASRASSPASTSRPGRRTSTAAIT